MLDAIAIDGPSGAGKSTVARLLARRLHMDYLDTGAMYRALALYMLRQGVDVEDAEGVAGYLPEIDLSIQGSQVLLNGEDVSQAIRTDEVSEAASHVSAIKAVREKLVRAQRQEAESKPSILDGRDIGTVVLPDARLKIFLTASPEVRAKRRLQDEKYQGQASYEDLLASMKARDQYDREKPISPLKPAPDAHILDSSDMTLEETVEAIVQLWEA